MSTYSGNITIDPSDFLSQTIDISKYSIGAVGASGTYSIGPSTSGLTLGTASTSIYTTTGTGAGNWGGYDNAAVKLGKDGISVDETADIRLGKLSLKDFIERIEQRLALLSPNPELEKEWEELKELGDRYRELEKHIKEKMRTWEILKREDNTD